MASEDINKGQESLRRPLWPAIHTMTQSSEKNSGEKKLTCDTQQQQPQTNTTSLLLEEECDDVFPPNTKQYIDEMKLNDGFKNQEYIESGRTDEECRQACLADLYEGPYVNIGRPILVPVSRLRRTELRGTNARIFNDSPVDLPFPAGFRRESPGAFVGSPAPDITRVLSTPIHLGSLSVGEALRSNKNIRLEKEENTGMDSDPHKSNPGAGNHLIFDASPQNLLALGINGKTIDSAQSSSVIDTDTIKCETAPSTPPPSSTHFQWEDGSYGTTPDRPRTAKTTPAAMCPYIDAEPEESPTPRLKMGRLRISSADDLDSGPAASSGSFGHYGGRAHSPHPYYFGSPVPHTPTKGKRARSDFEKTTTLSGRDVARERDILAHFAAAAKEEDEEEEKEEGEEDEDEEDEELTPKASVLNRHMDIDGE
ncbi:hypothetical protein CSUB01_03255 [Colletotrichum sublineola]|uniref:Uncharacterized protein n=1 Tax=Colletotrichum sublineola TaxID=1173701 RepID=A0A066XAX6_COLSU|nr:hypothetical protein CSUB01_03255 [Colletotrichum sublineola]